MDKFIVNEPWYKTLKSCVFRFARDAEGSENALSKPCPVWTADRGNPFQPPVH